MIEIPENLKIGHYEWRVKLVDEMREEGVWGHCDHETLTITLWSKLPAIHLMTTFLHEVMHATLARAGINEQDELQVNSLSIGLVEVLRDNPALVSAITGNEL